MSMGIIIVWVFEYKLPKKYFVHGIILTSYLLGVVILLANLSYLLGVVILLVNLC